MAIVSADGLTVLCGLRVRDPLIVLLVFGSLHCSFVLFAVQFAALSVGSSSVRGIVRCFLVCSIVRGVVNCSLDVIPKTRPKRIPNRSQHKYERIEALGDLGNPSGAGAFLGSYGSVGKGLCKHCSA